LTQAERNVRRTEVLNAVAQAEGIEISDDEINAELALSSEDQAEVRRLQREASRRPEFKERIAAMMRRQRATRLLLETVGGVDFAALEAADAATEDDDEATALALDDAVEEAVEEAEIVAALAEDLAAAEDLATSESPVATEATAEVATPAGAATSADQSEASAGTPSGPASASTGSASAPTGDASA
jgi:hypothetical protein